MATATKTTTTATPDKDIEQLSLQIAALKKDIAGITTTLSNLGSSTGAAAVNTAKRTAEDLRIAGERKVAEAQVTAEDLGKQAADAVRQQPAAAMGLAVGLGFLLGFLSGRK